MTNVNSINEESTKEVLEVRTTFIQPAQPTEAGGAKHHPSALTTQESKNSRVIAVLVTSTAIQAQPQVAHLCSNFSTLTCYNQAAHARNGV